MLMTVSNRRLAAGGLKTRRAGEQAVLHLLDVSGVIPASLKLSSNIPIPETPVRA
jgi:hypothetical protein